MINQEAPPVPQPRPPGRLARFVRGLHPATFPLALGAVGLAGATLVHFVDPHEPGHYPTCPWLALTGTFCPGCGSMRAVNALTNLNIVGAAQMNVLLLAVLPFMAVAYVRWVYVSFRPERRTRTTMAHPLWLWGILGLILAYWVVRNLPFGAVLAPS